RVTRTVFPARGWRSLQAKALAAQQGKWSETLPNLASQTCPNERWVYEVSPGGEMSLSFSREFDWRQPDPDSGAVYLPLSYRADFSELFSELSVE
ncbi:MAG: hypothetical protein AAGB19_19670, partial [Cyanobacteria bacterium P01_F01_bin.3]